MASSLCHSLIQYCNAVPTSISKGYQQVQKLEIIVILNQIFLMDLQEIKMKLHSNIDLIEDETKLEMLNEAAEAYATNQADILDLLTAEQRDRLDQSISQADEGKLTSNEEVMKLSQQWLTK
ncbi:MAG: hypothetical protein JWQ96_3252 [Segetibacter sp.]|nr:hypothetical protein [Segetibacter sp.]